MPRGKRWAGLLGVVTEQSASRLCSVCFDGNYPIELPRQTALGKGVMQCTLANAARTGANPASVMQSENDNVPALRRP